ncbi:hypothetical protein GJR96_10730 [Haloferax sp. MBLA0076]|uniref:Glycine zipper-like domain-containing protein n=1 Tax=Haloferax litoreum TaxID=2666140 RepID=A0A6A8GI41_9EURY|nr:MULTISPECIES: hypothetical protein [Haloferax]KAB1193886.1 hypothetical protein Hfx1148_10690 [Haloferax sp. CBA1148]MRX22431.1 hypothetical protein [Haloferax litoreum]
MSQESVSLSAEAIHQQTPAEPMDHVMVDSDDRSGSSHSAEQFGIGLAAGILIGGIAGVIGNSLTLGVMSGLILGVVLGIYVMERR